MKLSITRGAAPWVYRRCAAGHRSRRSGSAFVLFVLAALLPAPTAVWSDLITPGSLLVAHNGTPRGVDSVDPGTGAQTAISTLGGPFQGETYGMALNSSGNIDLATTRSAIYEVNGQTGATTPYWPTSRSCPVQHFPILPLPAMGRSS